MLDTYEEYKLSLDNLKSKWLNENCSTAMLMGPWIISLQPDLGKLFTVDGFQIYEEIFPDEFNKIKEAYFSVLEKLEKHYKSLILNNKEKDL